MDLVSLRKSAKISRDSYKFEIFHKDQQLSLVIVKLSESLNYKIELLESLSDRAKISKVIYKNSNLCNLFPLARPTLNCRL